MLQGRYVVLLGVLFGLGARKLFANDAEFAKESYFLWAIIGAVCGVLVLLTNGWDAW